MVASKRTSEKRMTYSYTPLSQRFGTLLAPHWVHILICVNLIIFLWLIIPKDMSYSSGFSVSTQCSPSGNEIPVPSRSPISSPDTAFSPPSQTEKTPESGALQSSGCDKPLLVNPFLNSKPDCLSNFYKNLNFQLRDEVDHLVECQQDESKAYFTSPNGHFSFLPITVLPRSNKKIISFSLYGTAPRYLHNVIRIIHMYRQLLPDWTPRFWLGSDVPLPMINRLVYEGSEVIIVYQHQPDLKNQTRPPSYHGMFWRFFVADDPHIQRYIVRDADSMPLQREVDAMNQWISEGTMFHVMRDHRYHGVEILGGMWGGIVDTSVFNVSQRYEQALRAGYDKLDQKGLDQTFLASYLWKLARGRVTCHAAYRWKYVDHSGCKDFPTQRNGNEFVGAVISDY